MLGLVLIDRPRLLVVIICLAALDGGKLVIPWNVPTGFLKWFLESGKPDILRVLVNLSLDFLRILTKDFSFV